MKDHETDILRINHPISKRDRSFKYLYCFGVGVMAMGNMKAISELQWYFEKLMDSVELEDDSRNNIITDINSFFDMRMNELLRSVKGKEDQYCLIADLYKIYQYSLWSQDYCNAIIDNYMDIFRFSDEEHMFFENFSDASHHNNHAKAKEAYDKFKNAGYNIDYGILTYFYPDFHIEENYKDIRVEAGKTLILDKPVTIEGDIFIERGGSLLIKGAFVRMSGHIWADGGRLQIKDARVFITGCDDTYWIRLNKVAVVHIESTNIDCGYNCGLLYQDSGRLIISETNVQRTDISRAIDFRGRSAIIDDTKFTDNKKGAIDIFGSARMIISKCTFEDSYADYGGAIRSETIGNVKFEFCSFRHCQAKYLGAAVYFKFRKYGQYVKECECLDCIPDNEAIFNVYDDDLEMNI